MIACRYCGSRNNTPNIPKMPAAASTIPTLKVRERNRPRSISGWPFGRAVRKASQATKAASTASEMIDGTTALAEPQPLSPASTRPYIRRARPALESETPTTSMLGLRSLRDCGTKMAAAVRPIRTTGTFIRKTQPHQKWAST